MMLNSTYLRWVRRLPISFVCSVFGGTILLGLGGTVRADVVQPEPVSARAAPPTADDLGLPPGIVLYTIPEADEPDIVWLSDLAGGRFQSAALAANENTWIAGYGTDNEGSKAVVWRPLQGGRWELIPLPSDGPAQAFGINAAGNIVGTVQQRPALWTHDQASDTWKLQLLEGNGTAISIDAEGDVIDGQLKQDGRWEPTRWTLAEGNWVSTPVEPKKSAVDDLRQEPSSNFFVSGVTATGATTGFALKANCLPMEGVEGGSVVACDEVQEAFLRLPGGGGGVPAFAETTPTSAGQSGLPSLGGLANSGFPAAFGGGSSGGGGSGGGGGGDDGKGDDDGKGPDGEPVPEPATLVAWLLLTAVFGLAALRRRRQYPTSA